jgi:hypothetical protein
MEATWLDILTRFVLPPLLGGAGGLITIWANWRIEKRKQRFQHHRELINAWRLELLPMVASSQDAPEIWAGPKQAKVLNSVCYASLKPHLSDKAVKEIEDPNMRLVLNMRGAPPRGDHWAYNFPLKIFIDEIARIEREWDLV